MPEDSIGEQLGVSRTLVREALGRALFGAQRYAAGLRHGRKRGQEILVEGIVFLPIGAALRHLGAHRLALGGVDQIGHADRIAIGGADQVEAGFGINALPLAEMLQDRKSVV